LPAPLLTQFEKSQLPHSGILKMQFKSLKRPAYKNQAISEEEFHAMWTATVQGQRNTTDEWLMCLLHALCSECYLNCSQAARVIHAFNYGESKIEAAVKVWGYL
jgi:hypothetical protein